jgi:transposase
MLFDAHTRSFGSLGGVPRRGIYDNMKTAVDKVNKGKGGVWGAMEPKTNVSSESHRKGAFRSPAHPPGITL